MALLLFLPAYCFAQSVTITTPTTTTNNYIAGTNSTITVAATASGGLGFINNVTFSIGSTISQAVTSSPYTTTLNITSLAPGTYTLTATNNYTVVVLPGSVSATISINIYPAAPGVTPASSCGPGAVTLLATGSPTGGTYNWYSVATGGTALQTSTSATYTTPSLLTTTTYYVSYTSGGLESARTPVTATINTIPTAAFTASSAVDAGSNGTVTLTSTYSAANTYAWNFGSGATPATATGQGPFTVRWASTGLKTITLTVTSAAGCVAAATQNVTVNASSFGSYAFHLPLTLNTTGLGITTDQTNFPFLISITDPSLVITAGSCSNKVQFATGPAYDIAFVDAVAGEIPYQVESYNTATGTLLAWVKLPTLSHITNNTLSLFFGSGTAPATHTTAFYQSTWASDYQVVYHFNEATYTGTVIDATSNGHNGTASNMTSANLVTGKIGTDYSFNGSSTTIAASALSVNGSGSTTGFTTSAWINLGAVGNDQKILSDETADGGANGFKLGVFTNNIPEADGAGTTTRNQGTSPTALTTGTWHYVQGVYTGGTSGTLSTYVDGVQYNKVTVAANTNQTTTGALGVGYDGPAGNSGYFNGNIDEVRVSTVAKPSDWIKAEYNNQNNPSSFTAVGTLVTNFTNASAIAGGITYTTTDGTNYSYTINGSTTTAALPSNGTANVVISAASTNVASAYSIYSLTVNSSDALNLNGQTLNVGCNIVNNGTIQNTAGTPSTLAFNGSVASQTYTGGASAAAQLDNLTINNSASGTVTVTGSGINVYNTLTLTQGNLVINNAGGGALTLKSTATQTAAVATLPGAINTAPTYTVTGNISAERFVTGGAVASYRGYRTMTSPVSSTGTTGGLIDMSYVPASTIVTGVALTGVTCSLCTTTGTPSLYLYDEQEAVNNSTFISGNFVGVTSINGTTLGITNSGSTPITGAQSLPAGNGFYLFFRGNNISATGKTTQVSGAFANPENVVFTSTGILNQGPITVKDWFNQGSSILSYTSTTGTVARGFNLAGNPYASSINWDNFSSTASSNQIYGPNMLPGIYTYNTTTKNYSVYLPGSTVNSNGTASGTASGSAGGSNIVASGQGFFIQVDGSATPAAAQLIFNEGAKLSTNAQPATLLLNSAPPGLALADKHLRLQLFKDSVNKDESVILFNQAANVNYQPLEDAVYVKGSGVVSLSITSPNNYPMAISKQPLPNQRQVIPLHLNVTQNGNYQLNLTEAVNIPNLFNVWLMDAAQNDSLDFKHNPTYSFTANLSDTTTYGSKRFSLVISQDTSYAFHLLSFSGAKVAGGSLLNWTTENEDDYTAFSLQRSIDGGKTFNSLTTFTSGGGGAYSYLDTQPAPGQNQYKLQVQDVNGVITYSGIVILTYPGGLLTALSNKIGVYPNPVSDRMNLSITLAPDMPASSFTITIMSNTGKIVKTITSTQTSWSSSLSDLTPGVYIIKVVDNNGQALIGTDKFVKI